MLTQLIPFKVKQLPIPKENLIFRGDGSAYHYIRNTYLSPVNITNMEGYWTVVGADNINFLLIRDGYLSKWYPQEFCEVILETR